MPRNHGKGAALIGADAERRELIERMLMRRQAASPSEAHKRSKELAV